VNERITVRELLETVTRQAERIAELEKDKVFLLTQRFMGNTIISTEQGLSDAIKAHNLEQQIIGFDAAIDAALDLDLIENDVHVCNLIKEQAKAKGGAE
jgi:hypothetical protein